jgi:hypothetical protein
MLEMLSTKISGYFASLTPFEQARTKRDIAPSVAYFGRPERAERKIAVYLEVLGFARSTEEHCGEEFVFQY